MTAISPSTILRAAAILETQANRLYEQSDELLVRSADVRAQAEAMRALVEDDRQLRIVGEWLGPTVAMGEDGGAG